MNRRKTVISAIAITILLLTVIVICASVGSANLSVADSLKIIMMKIPGLSGLVDSEAVKPMYIRIIWNIRVPRILLAGLSGATLAMVGACFQGLFHNPLADPQIIGVSSGAALGATLAILSGLSLSFLGLSVIGVFAFIGAIITVFFVYQLSCTGNKASVVHIVLTGTAVSTMLSAVISLLITINGKNLEKVYMWTLGSFSAATMTKVKFLLVFFVIGASILMMFSKELDIIATGEDTALSLGVDTAKVKKILIIASAFLVAACVSVCGTIGFVGLIIPHCVRMIFGPKHGRLLWLSALCGAIFLILCDTLARTIAAPGELPVGIITSLCGGPYFIFLLYRSKKRMVL